MTNTNTNTENDSVLTPELLKEMLLKISKDPWFEFMEEQGCSPDNGWKLLLPLELKDENVTYPSYVRFSWVVEDPTLLQTPREFC